MTTSANVTYYRVYRNDILVFETSQHAYCKDIKLKEQLAQFQPPEHFELIACHPDEDEVDHYTVSMTVAEYLGGKSFVWEDDVPRAGTGMEFAYVFSCGGLVQWSKESRDSIGARGESDADRDLIADFVEGSYPGSFVRLATGEMIFCTG